MNIHYSRDEMMTVTAARRLKNNAVCFVGIGLPSAACNLARLTHAPDIVLIYESGTIGTKPKVLPLSIGDGELAETADCIIPLPEVFSHLLQAGRIDTGFLGAAQIDKFANLNSTVIGDYQQPGTRLPGAGGAPEIAMHAKEVLIVLKQSPRTFVERVSFRTSVGFGDGSGDRQRMGLPGHGPSAVITDYGVMTPDPQTQELTLTEIYPGVTVEQARAATGWDLKVSAQLTLTAEPTAQELTVLRQLNQQTAEAHQRSVALPVY